MSWKRNMASVWLSQFLSIMGFTFAMPFAPYFMQELGVAGDRELKLWVALFGAAAPLSLAVFSPIWGAVADRYGRRPMLLRANLGAALMLCLMGTAGSAAQLVALRGLQGVLTGTMTAAQALVAASTPRRRSGLAMGALASAVFSGATTGFFVGGLFADAFGYRNAFFGASVLLVISALLVLFGTRESFVRPDGGRAGMRRKLSATAGRVRLLLPALFLVGAVSMVRRFDHNFIPLLVQEIHGGIRGVSRWTGLLFAGAGVAGFLSSILCGHLADRFRPARLLRTGALCAGVLMIPQYFIRDFALLFVIRALLAFCVGGMDPVLQGWLAKHAVPEMRGELFGWVASARAWGWMFGPLFAGAVAAGPGLRFVFLAGALLFWALVPAIEPLQDRALTGGGPLLGPDGSGQREGEG